MTETYTAEEFEEMEDESLWDECQLYLRSDEYIQQQEIQTGRNVHQPPPWLNKHLSKEKRDKLLIDYKKYCLDKDNPYRTNSSYRKLLDDIQNFRIIETNLLLHLIKSGLSGREFSVFFYIFHRTRGFNKYTVKMFIKDITDYTGISKKHTYKILESLKEKQMIYEVSRPDNDPDDDDKKNNDRNKHIFGVNWYYSTWKLN